MQPVYHNKYVSTFNKITCTKGTYEKKLIQAEVFFTRRAGDEFADRKINKETIKQLQTPQITKLIEQSTDYIEKNTMTGEHLNN
jgi:hypothetical protein